MNRFERLLELLSSAFPNGRIELFDDSAAHAGHAHGESGETHYRLRIWHETFSGMSRIAAHRKILAAVKSETDAGLHSFAIEKVSPDKNA
jgi:BolA family transcriptional regulator, general stress-responsive regulator